MSQRHREKIYDFTGGLNTRDRGAELQEFESPDMKNVLPGKRGGFEIRPGTQKFRQEPVSSKENEDGSYPPVTSIHEFAREIGTRHLLAFAGDELKRATSEGWELIRDGFAKNSYFEFIYHPYEDQLLFVNGADGYWETDGFEANKVAAYEPREFGDPGDADYINEEVEIGSCVIPEKPKLIAFFDHRVWLANIDGSSDRIYFNVDDIDGNRMYNYFTPWSWLRASNVRGEPITALLKFQEYLLVFNQTSIKAIIPDEPVQLEEQVYTPPAYRMEDVSTNVGAVSQRAVQDVGGRVVFLSIDGVYLFDGDSAPYKISNRIDPTLKNIDQEAWQYVCSGFWDNKYFLSAPTE